MNSHRLILWKPEQENMNEKIMRCDDLHVAFHKQMEVQLSREWFVLKLFVMYVKMYDFCVIAFCLRF